MRTAHIVTTPHEVGDRVLALCGKEHKVKTLWADIDLENFICRDCVDVAIRALDEADAVIMKSRVRLNLVSRSLIMLTETIAPEDGMDIDEIAWEAADFAHRQADKADRKADAKRVKRTCTCEWEHQGSLINRVQNPDCPIHGGQVAEGGLPELGDE